MVGIVERLVPDELWELFQRVVPEAPSRPQGGDRRPAQRPGGAGRDRVRCHVGLYLAAAAFGIVRPVRSDCPPAVLGVVEGPGVGQAPPPGPRRTRSPRRPGLVAVRDRLGEHAGPEKGDLTGPNPADRRQVRLEDPPDHGTIRSAHLHWDLGCEPARQPITHCITRKGVESSQRLGRHRWTVERPMAWLMRLPPPPPTLRTQKPTTSSPSRASPAPSSATADSLPDSPTCHRTNGFALLALDRQSRNELRKIGSSGRRLPRQEALVVVGYETTQVCLGRLITAELKGDLMRLTRHTQRSGQGVEPQSVLVGHLPPCLGGRSVREDVHVVVVIEEDHGAYRCSHSWSMSQPPRQRRAATA